MRDVLYIAVDTQERGERETKEWYREPNRVGSKETPTATALMTQQFCDQVRLKSYNAAISTGDVSTATLSLSDSPVATQWSLLSESESESVAVGLSPLHVHRARKKNAHLGQDRASGIGNVRLASTLYRAQWYLPSRLLIRGHQEIHEVDEVQFTKIAQPLTGDPSPKPLIETLQHMCFRPSVEGGLEPEERRLE
ncbi:hypothetical protein B0H19DRAFT_1066874 [Mycena capillaripes]|nr:hypothetical protein B0H19DRAFT_1066874 [Mycena capillaripes]